MAPVTAWTTSRRSTFPTASHEPLWRSATALILDTVGGALTPADHASASLEG